MALVLRATGRDRRPIDAAEVRRALAVLADPGAGVQIQGLPTGRWRIVPGGDLDAALAAVTEFADDNGIYFSLNPCPPDRAAPIKASVMLGRRWLLIDCDAVRPTDTNATDAEHDATRDVGAKVMDWLTSEGWPQPVCVDSGNGWHLLYRVELPNDKLSHAILRRLLYAVGERFDTTAVNIDRGVHNANRISKLPGTWVRKGPVTDDRPHRVAKLVHLPEPVNLVTVEQLQKVAGLSEKKADEKPPGVPPRKPLMPFVLSAGTNGSAARTTAYARKALGYESLRVRLATEGKRNTILNDAAFRCGTMVGAHWLLQQEVEAELLFAAHMTGLTAEEATDVVGRAIKAGMENPRAELPPQPGKGPGAEGTADTAAADEPLTVCAASITPQKVEWLWPDRVPKRFITVLAGRTGLGKSFVTLDAVARMTVGGEMPFGGGECFPLGSALIISEDPPEFMIVPRLIEMKADLNRVRFMSWTAMGRYTIADVAYLDRAVAEVDQCRMVVIDPPTNFLGETDENANAEIRRMLMQLVIWLKENDLACVLIMHVNKQTGKGIEAVGRVLGSVAWVSTARIAHAFTPDPENEERGLFVPMKNNLGPLAKALSYEICATENLARVEWLAEVDTTANEAMNKEPKRVRRDLAAKDWLIDRFRQNLRWSSSELFKAGKAVNISRNAIFEAKKILDLPDAKKITLANGDVEYTWWVPPDWPQLLVSQPTAKASGTPGHRDTSDEEAI